MKVELRRELIKYQKADSY